MAYNRQLGPGEVDPRIFDDVQQGLSLDDWLKKSESRDRLRPKSAARSRSRTAQRTDLARRPRDEVSKSFNVSITSTRKSSHSSHQEEDRYRLIDRQYGLENQVFAMLPPVPKDVVVVDPFFPGTQCLPKDGPMGYGYYGAEEPSAKSVAFRPVIVTVAGLSEWYLKQRQINIDRRDLVWDEACRCWVSRM